VREQSTKAQKGSVDEDFLKKQPMARVEEKSYYKPPMSEISE